MAAAGVGTKNSPVAKRLTAKSARSSLNFPRACMKCLKKPPRTTLISPKKRSIYKAEIKTRRALIQPAFRFEISVAAKTHSGNAFFYIGLAQRSRSSRLDRPPTRFLFAS